MNKLNDKQENPIDKLADEIASKGVKVTFGIQPHHIERIESEIERWDNMSDPKFDLPKGYVKYAAHFWESRGREFGWQPLTLALYYFEYLDKTQD